MIQNSPMPIRVSENTILLQPEDPSMGKTVTSPLIWSVLLGRPHIATYFLETSELEPDSNAYDSEGRTMLIAAARNLWSFYGLRCDSFEFLLQTLSREDVNVNQVDLLGQNFLHKIFFASSCRASDMFDQIDWLRLISGVSQRSDFDWNAKDKLGSTFLHLLGISVPFKMVDFIRELLGQDIPVDFKQTDRYGQTFLQASITEVDVDILQMLPQVLNSTDFDWNSQDEEGENILHTLARENCVSAIVTLLRLVVDGQIELDVNRRNNEARTFLHCLLAKNKGQTGSTIQHDVISMVELLHQVKFDWHAIDRFGETLDLLL